MLETIRTLRFPFTVRHQHGPTQVDAQTDDLIVTCLVRNGEAYIKEFIDHYRKLGVRHIVFLDNGSTDNTVSMACRHKDITVLSTDAPFSTYQTIMRRYLLSRYGKENWVLCADIDEFFDYPHSDQIKLSDFLNYLNENKYNVVALQMLDMIPGKPLSEIEPDHSFKDTHLYYDISNISKYDYESNSWLNDNVISNSGIKTHRGGIRQELFNMRSERPLLSKHTLLRLTRGLCPEDVRTHHIDNAFIADVSGVLYHYKFTSNFTDYVQRAVQKETFSNDSEEYKSYLKELKEGKTALRTSNMKRIEGTEELIDSGFLKISKAYDRYVKESRRS